MGKKAGIIVLDENGNMIEREGTFHLKGETIVGGWAKVYIKGYETPEYAAVSFEEYAGRKSNGELNSQWASKPATMIRKVALVQALREAFPEETAGMYAPEEIPEASEIVLEDSASEPVPVPEEMTENSVNTAPAEDVQGALFG